MVNCIFFFFQFFLREDDIGNNRAAVTGPRLADLNTYVPIYHHVGELTDEFILNFQVGGVKLTIHLNTKMLSYQEHMT